MDKPPGETLKRPQCEDDGSGLPAVILVDLGKPDAPAGHSLFQIWAMALVRLA